MIPERPAFLVSADRSEEPAALNPSWPVLRTEDLRTLDDLGRWNFDFVFPLVSPASGHIQGMLEFLGLPYAGASMAAFVWAQRQNLAQPAASGEVTHSIRYEAQSVRPPAFNADVRFLRLSGWSLVTTGSHSGAPVHVEVSPPLRPGYGFLKRLATEGVAVEAFFQAEIAAGWSRFHAEHSLKTHYKDTV